MLNDKDKDFIVDALNAYWNDAYTQLQRKDLGDFERTNYVFQNFYSKVLMDKFSDNFKILTHEDFIKTEK
jgi:hypothetical protein